MLKSLSIFSVVVLFVACSSTVRYQKVNYDTEQAEPDEIIFRKENDQNDYNKDVLETQTGIASYYADQYNGKPTYSGDIYDMNGLTAAHPSYRMGTIVRVTNLYNKKSVTIPINDRMPLHPERIIDVSYGAAKALDMAIAGIVDVRVEVLKWGEGKK
ncbi:MAG: rare lipoprotein A [Ignavibacteria bacterium]|nr:MAG: rare lipoprotein A [Ignavibacteria bacterium]KAF0156406.1 MAG: rare lipoprotein A [Ignavibacteria bacterium]